MAVRYLCADTHPDHDIICGFRRNNLEAVAAAFVDVLELARVGDLVGVKTLKSITVLSDVSGSPGTTHSFNNAGAVLYRATFTDGSQSLVLVQVP